MNDEIQEVASSSTNNPIFDIVTSIQNKLNEQTPGEPTPVSENVKTKDLSSLDLSKIVDLLKNNESNNMNKNSNSSIPNLGGLDLGSLMNFKNAFSSINQSDPRQNLLNSLKPFLRETRQKNIDTYISLLGIMKVFNIFSSKDRD